MSSTSDLVDLPQGLNGDIKERLTSYLKSQRKKAETWERTQGKVSKDLCDLIHDMYDDGMPGTQIAEILPVGSQNTVYYHLRDDCSHEHRDSIKYDECGWMRFHASNGAPSSTLSVLYDCSQAVASRHVTGKCSHIGGPEPVDAKKLRENGRSEPDMAITVCDECGEKFEHKAYREPRFCGYTCKQTFAARKGAKVVNKKRWGGRNEQDTMTTNQTRIITK